jgi:membrane protein
MLMRNRMHNLWTLGGMSFPELLRRTLRECWHDEVFGQGGRMAFYHFLSIFPSLLIVFTISALIPHLGGHMKNAFQDLTSQLLPNQASVLLQQITTEFNDRAQSRLALIPVCAAALWAALNGTWALVYGLNKAYEVEEHRSWRELSLTIGGLTFFLAVVGSMAVFLLFCSAYLQSRFPGWALALRALNWLVLAGALSFCFAVLYRFAPNLRDCAWRWSTPGALCAAVLWITSTFATRLYFEHVNNYSRSYGHLNGVVMLLLWLYVSNGAILIGGEMNSEIEKHITEAQAGATRQDRSRIRK